MTWLLADAETADLKRTTGIDVIPRMIGCCFNLPNHMRVFRITANKQEASHGDGRSAMSLLQRHTNPKIKFSSYQRLIETCLDRLDTFLSEYPDDDVFETAYVRTARDIVSDAWAESRTRSIQVNPISESPCYTALTYLISSLVSFSNRHGSSQLKTSLEEARHRQRLPPVNDYSGWGKFIKPITSVLLASCALKPGSNDFLNAPLDPGHCLDRAKEHAGVRYLWEAICFVVRGNWHFTSLVNDYAEDWLHETHGITMYCLTNFRSKIFLNQKDGKQPVIQPEDLKAPYRALVQLVERTRGAGLFSDEDIGGLVTQCELFERQSFEGTEIFRLAGFQRDFSAIADVLIEKMRRRLLDENLSINVDERRVDTKQVYSARHAAKLRAHSLTAASSEQPRSKAVHLERLFPGISEGRSI